MMPVILAISVTVLPSLNSLRTDARASLVWTVPPLAEPSPTGGEEAVPSWARVGSVGGGSVPLPPVPGLESCRTPAPGAPWRSLCIPLHRVGPSSITISLKPQLSAAGDGPGGAAAAGA